MKPVKNTAFFAGAADGSQTAFAVSGKRNQAGNKKLNAISLQEGNELDERIAKKRAEGRGKAVKFIQDQFSSDRDRDNSIAESRAAQKEYQQEGADAGAEVKRLREAKEALQENYGITDEGKQDMPEEYLQGMEELDSAIKVFEQKEKEAESKISGEHSAIYNTNQSIVKAHEMEDAYGNEEAQLEVTSKEIIGMVQEAAKEHIDEELEKAVDEAKETKEEKEEKEEVTKEAAKEEEQTQEIAGSQTEMDRLALEMKEMLDNQKLLDEDLKGVVVSTQV